VVPQEGRVDKSEGWMNVPAVVAEIHSKIIKKEIDSTYNNGDGT